MMKKAELGLALSNSSGAVLTFFESYPAEQFRTERFPGKWTAGQHLRHLMESTKAVRQALAYPRLLLLYKFGRMNRTERNFDGLVSRYLEKLALSDGRQPDSRFDPRIGSMPESKLLMDLFSKESDRLIQSMNRWDEKALSKYILPHPLLGKLSLREMLMFTALHNRHHLTILEEKYL